MTISIKGKSEGSNGFNRSWIIALGDSDESEVVPVSTCFTPWDRSSVPIATECRESIAAVGVPPIMRFPEGSRQSGVLDSNTAGPPGVKVAPATAMPAGSAVKAWPPTVRMDESEGLSSVIVALPMTVSPDEPRLIEVPARIIAGLPGATV